MTRNAVQTFHLPYQNSASLLSQLHLRLFTGSTQRAKLYLCAVYQNSGVGNCFLKSTEKLREATLLSAGAAVLVSFLLFSKSCLPKILIILWSTMFLFAPIVLFMLT